MSQNIHDHIPLGNGTLCGSNSFAAIHRVADCARCVQRLHKVLDILLDVATDQPGAVAKAKKLVAKWRLTRGEERTENV
jgi:hypothetical protein